MLNSLFEAVSKYLDRREQRATVKFLEKSKASAESGLMLWPTPYGNVAVLLSPEDSVKAVENCEQGIACVARKQTCQP